MKTETNPNVTDSSNVWATTEDLPPLTHEFLPVIGSCQVSSILSNLEESNKILHQDVELPQNMETLVVCSNFKLNNEDIVPHDLNATDYVIIKGSDDVPKSKGDKKLQSLASNKSKTRSKVKNSSSYIFCDLCPFLTLSNATMSTHIENGHKNGMALKLNKFKCPGCSNIFYHRISLRSHLMYDHGISPPELLQILQTVTFQSKKQLNGKIHLDNKPLFDAEEFKPEEVDLKSISHPIELTAEIALPDESTINKSISSIRVLNLTEIENPKQQILEVPTANFPVISDSKTSTTKPPNYFVKKSSSINSNNAVSKIINDKKVHKCAVPSCKIKFTDSKKLAYHVNCHLEQRYQCPECHETFEFWNIIASHLWRLHKIDMELYSCDKCDYKTYSLAKLNNIHKLIHSDVKAFKCDLCKKSFKNTKQLRNHKTTHRQRIDGAIFLCEFCKKPFNDKRQLRIHTDGVHKKIKPFLCSFCGYKGATRGALKTHMRQHTGEKPFACNHCAFTTSDHNSLRRHKLRHTGHKPYKCCHCDYACIQSSTYKVHLKTKHPGLEKELLFSCSECSYRTINKNFYTSHMSSVHKQIKL